MAERSDKEFVMLITGFQSRLYSYILSLMGDPELTGDVLQETNLALWNKIGEFELGTNFGAWAYRIAYYQVLAQRQRRGRERIIFSDDLIAKIAERTVERSDRYEARQKALHHCLEKINARQRELIRRHYSSGESVKKIAQSEGESANAVAQALFRARAALLRCINRNTVSEEQP